MRSSICLDPSRTKSEVTWISFVSVVPDHICNNITIPRGRILQRILSVWPPKTKITSLWFYLLFKKENQCNVLKKKCPKLPKSQGMTSKFSKQLIMFQHNAKSVFAQSRSNELKVWRILIIYMYCASLIMQDMSAAKLY